ncbi:MAG TPA: hypothetical protein VJT80_20120 [Steroidobacteraceae bacterium]|nr:hypothetical protein [Steroidobacteraceae bacterium]
MTHARHAAATIHLLGASQVSNCLVFEFATPVAFIAQLCDARAERARRLKPFVACCDLIIVIPLYAWERIRVMTINHKATDRDANVQFSGDAGAVSGGWFEERGGVCG